MIAKHVLAAIVFASVLPASAPAWAGDKTLPAGAQTLPGGNQTRPASGPVNIDTRALDYLKGLLADPNGTPVVLGSLAATEDANLVPLFLAYSRCTDKRCRLFAIATLADLKGDAALAGMRQRAAEDPVMLIRQQALERLLTLKAIEPPQLMELIKTPDEDFQRLCAQGLVLAGKGEQAKATLTALADSKDPSIACRARVSLLGLGMTQYKEPLAKVIADPTTPTLVLALLIDEITREKIAPAADLAEQVFRSAQTDTLKLQALRAISEASPVGLQRVLDTIRDTDKDKIVFRVMAMRLLASKKDARNYIAALAQDKDAVGAMARFEIARIDGSSDVAKAAAEVAAAKHPMILVHLLARIKEDVAAKAAWNDSYVPILAEIVRSVPPQEGAVSEEQEFAAWAALLLADINSEKSLASLKELLSGHMSDWKRAAAGGLLKTASTAAASLATPLLDCPYGEISTEAAIALARHGNPAARDALVDIVTYPHRYRPQVVVMACWYLRKTDGLSAETVRQLAQMAD